MFARSRRVRRDAGFSMVELLVVVIIIGILAAIAIPLFINQRQKGYDADAKSDLRNAALAEESHLGDSGVYSTDIGPSSSNDVQYRKTPGVGDISAVMTDTSGAKVAGTTSSTGFCLAAQSQSGTWFAYSSAKGGLQSASFSSAATACP